MSLIYEIKLEMSENELDMFVRMYGDYVNNVPLNRYHMTFPEWLTKFVNNHMYLFVDACKMEEK